MFHWGPLKIQSNIFNDSLLSYYTNVISASHSKKFSSLTGPANIPSGGLFVNSKIESFNMRFIFSKLLRLYSAIKRRRG